MFEFFEHKADIGIKGFGLSVEQAFQECAKGLFEVMTDTTKVKAKTKTIVKVKGKNLEELLANFLNELLYLKDTKKMFYSEFSIKIKAKKGNVSKKKPEF